MKKILMTTAICLAAISVNAQCKHKGYEVKAENSYTNYCVRQASNPRDAKSYDTQRLRSEYLIEKIMAPGEVNWTYTTIDRFLVGGAMPTDTPLKLTSIEPLYVDLSKSDNGRNLLDNREIGIINVGGDGSVTVDGKRYDLAFQEAIYVGKGVKEIIVASKNAQNPAKFYMNSACITPDIRPAMPTKAKFASDTERPIILISRAVTKPTIAPMKSEGAKIPPTPPAPFVATEATIFNRMMATK